MFRLRSLKNHRARNTPSYCKFPSRANINHSVFATLKPNRTTAVRVTVFTASSLLLASTVFTDDGTETIKESSLGSLVRAYTVYTMCSVPALVDASPRLLSFLTSIPGVKQITEAFVKITFFDQVWFQYFTVLYAESCFCQFVGGDTAIEALPLLRSLRSANKGILLSYSVEADEKKATGSSIPPLRESTTHLIWQPTRI